MILTTLVTGSGAEKREAAIASALDPHCRTAVILEGLPNGRTRLDEVTAPSLNVVHTTNDRPSVDIARIAPGCLCCTGNITMKVTLNRLIRSRPERLYIGLATNTHLENIRAFLAGEPYNKLLTLTDNLDAG